MVLLTQTTHFSPTKRRSGNYKPSIWKYEFLQTLKNEYTGDIHLKRAEQLISEVRHLLDHFHEENSPVEILELIDDIERLGLGYIFEQNIRTLLSFLHKNIVEIEHSLHATALCFRLFRQHGFNISQDVFSVFKDQQGGFAQHLSQDLKGMLSLFQASYLGRDGENIIDEAKKFSRKQLRNAKGSMIIDTYISELIAHALDLPLHFNITRLEARWYIDLYSKRKEANSTLIKLAKLDYNMVQATYQRDLMDMSRWWENLGVAKKLPFARDRLVESFLWGVGMAYEPQYKYCREGITKIVALITVIDDFYDVYATYDEAKIFTDAVERWDINAVEQLPYYIKLCFIALYNTVNEFAYNALRDHGLDILPYLRKKWVDQCKSYLLELKWYNTGYKPTLEEYMRNACISVTGPMIQFHTYVFMTPNITKEAMEYLDRYPDLIHWSSVIVRLTDDLATSSDEIARGDVPKAIQCYMKDEGVTEEVARQHIRYLTDEAWKKMNAEMWIDSPVPQAFVKEVLNCMRSGEFFYQYGDGHGIPDRETKGRVLSLIINPFSLE